MAQRPRFQVGGTLDPDASLYVRRPEDMEFMLAARRQKSWINIHGCRTMGKSSLYTKHLAALSRSGIDALIVDIAAEVGEQPTVTDWFRQLGYVLCLRLRRDFASIDDILRELPAGAAAGTVFEQLMVRTLLHNTKRRVFLILDEYDYIARLPYCDAILFALRHLQTIQSQSHTLDRFSICLVGLRPMHRFGTAGEANRVPYCTYIEMRDFVGSPSTVRSLGRGFPRTTNQPSSGALREVLALSGGQPLLTMHLLSQLTRIRRRTPDAVRKMANGLVAPSGTGTDLQLFETIEAALCGQDGDAFATLSVFKSFLDGRDEAHTAPEAERLLITGLLRRNQGKLNFKGDLFRRRFDAPWAERMLSRVAGHARMEQYRGALRTSAKHLCVINAGGTLGMLQRGDEVVPPENVEQLKSYFPALDSIASIELVNLSPRDSINVFPDQWITIARYIYQRRHDGFDGFVVAHGTDTMAYTASAVAFALGPHLTFPVVFTGAQTTPEVAYGDAHVNLYRACEVAKKPIPEVVISFGNFVYRAVRAQKKDDRRFDGFESPTYPPLAEITGEINVRDELLRRPPHGRGRDIKLRATFEQSVLIVPQFPGLEPGFFEHLLTEADDQSRCNGIIIQTLGAGNVTNLDPYSFVPFVERAFQRGIPVIVTSQYPPDPGSHTKYTPAQAPLKAGAIHAGNMTIAAAVTKFRWVLADVRRRANWVSMRPEEKRALVSRRMVEESVVGEF